MEKYIVLYIVSVKNCSVGIESKSKNSFTATQKIQ